MRSSAAMRPSARREIGGTDDPSWFPDRARVKRRELGKQAVCRARLRYLGDLPPRDRPFRLVLVDLLMRLTSRSSSPPSADPTAIIAFKMSSARNLPPVLARPSWPVSRRLCRGGLGLPSWHTAAKSGFNWDRFPFMTRARPHSFQPRSASDTAQGAFFSPIRGPATTTSRRA